MALPLIATENINVEEVCDCECPQPLAETISWSVYFLRGHPMYMVSGSANGSVALRGHILLAVIQLGSTLFEPSCKCLRLSAVRISLKVA